MTHNKIINKFVSPESEEELFEPSLTDEDNPSVFAFIANIFLILSFFFAAAIIARSKFFSIVSRYSPSALYRPRHKMNKDI